MNFSPNFETLKKALGNMEFRGSAGGGEVVVTVNGAMLIKQVKIDPSLLQKSEKETLENMIISAYNNAHSKVQQELFNKMQEMTGLGL